MILERAQCHLAPRPDPRVRRGCSIGTLGAETRLELGDSASYRRTTRLDMMYISELVEAILVDTDIKDEVRVWPNSSLYRAGRQLRHAEGRTSAGRRSYHLVAVDAAPHVTATLERAERGVVASELARAIATSEDVTLDEAQTFVRELIESQILVADLAPSVTGSEPIRELASNLSRHDETHETAALLERTRIAIAELDAQGLGNDPAKYRATARELEILPAKIDPARLFQVDMVKPVVRATLSPDVIDAMLDAISQLHRIAPASDDGLSDFRTAYRARYELREMPLTAVLDEEDGIGFRPNNGPSADPSPLLAGLPFAAEREGRHCLGRARSTFCTTSSNAYGDAGTRVYYRLRGLLDES